MIRKALVLTVTLGILAASAAGCGTIQATSNGILRPYAGAQLDSYVISHPQSSTLEKVGRAVDYPFSLGGDALLMVFTLPSNSGLLDTTSSLNR